MTTTFFDSNDYFIDEKVNFFKFANEYKVFNNKGEQIGVVMQKVSAGQKVLRLLLNKSMLPFTLEIRDAQQQMLTSIHRGWTFFMSKITIKNSDGQAIGYIQQKFKLLKPTFKIFDNDNRLIASITGDWKAWNFTIKSSTDNQIGSINKKWAGAMKEIFTSADKYNVHIEESFSNDAAKIIVLSCAITIDMVLKENK